MRLFHEIIELTPRRDQAMAVCRPIGSKPIPPDHVEKLRAIGDEADRRRDNLYFTRIDDNHAYLWHMIPSPMRGLERMLQ